MVHPNFKPMFMLNLAGNKINKFLTFFSNQYIMIMEAQNEVFNKILSGRLC